MMRRRRAATYLVDPVTGEERLVTNAGHSAPDVDRPAGVFPVDVTGGAGADPAPVSTTPDEESGS